MDRDKWLQIFNSIIRLQFFMKTQIDNGDVKKYLDDNYQEFLNVHPDIQKKENESIIGGDFFIAFSYLVFVRIIEYIDKETTSDFKNEIWDFRNWHHLDVHNFDELIKRYRIKIDILEKRKKNGSGFFNNDNEKLEDLNYRIRNSLSHFRYGLCDNGNLILEDINPRNNRVEMKLTINYFQFVNYVQDFGIVVHNIVRVPLQ